MLYVYLLLVFLLETSALQIGCISNVTFISNDITVTQINFTFDQCSCYQWLYNYSGFNYWINNQTCELFDNFTTDYTLKANTTTRFCFINQPPVHTSFVLTTKSAPDMTTISTRFSTDPTTIVVDVTTTHLVTTTLGWNSIGIAVASGNGNSSILNPYGVFVDEQYYIYIAEKGNSRISKWPPNPNGSASAPVFQTASGQLNAPPSLYVDSTTGGIYVADELNNRVMFFANGSTTGISVPGALSGTSPAVSGIYLDPNRTIFITDTGNNRIYNWFTNQTVAGGQGPGSNASQLNQPKRIFIDSNYTFYLTDYGNYRIQKYFKGATSGETVAGGYGTGSNSSQFSTALGVVVDSQGNILVCDSNNNRIQKWSPGAATGQTVAGNGTAGSASNQLNLPKSIALDKDNNLYVVDNGNLRILKFNAL